MQWTGQKLMFDLRRNIFRHLQRMHIGFFDAHAVGRLVTRLTSDVDAVNEMFTMLAFSPSLTTFSTSRSWQSSCSLSTGGWR